MTEERLQFDCDRDCPQHGRNDQRITQLEDHTVEFREDRATLMNEIEDVKKVIVGNHQDHQRRIGERVQIRHAIAAGILIASILTTVVTININTTNRIEDKLDNITADVAVLKAVSAERRKQEAYQREMLEEVRRFRQQSRDLRGVPD